MLSSAFTTYGGFCMTVGKKIELLRISRNWTKRQLALELGVSETTIHNYEIGNRGLRETHLQKLAKIFNIDASVLKNNHQENYNEVMQTLFMLADEYGLTTTDLQHVPPNDVVLVFSKRTLQEYLNAWHKKKNELEKENKMGELKNWELYFPNSFADDCEKLIREERNRLKANNADENSTT